MKDRRLLIAAGAGALVVIGAGIIAFGNVGGGGQQRTFEMSVTGTAMAPATISVKQNDTVTLKIRVDRTEEIHIHGYDLLQTIQSGQTGVYRFKADKSGDFEIEIETTSTTIGHLLVNQ